MTDWNDSMGEEKVTWIADVQWGAGWRCNRQNTGTLFKPSITKKSPFLGRLEHERVQRNEFREGGDMARISPSYCGPPSQGIVLWLFSIAKKGVGISRRVRSSLF